MPSPLKKLAGLSNPDLAVESENNSGSQIPKILKALAFAAGAAGLIKNRNSGAAQGIVSGLARVAEDKRMREPYETRQRQQTRDAEFGRAFRDAVLSNDVLKARAVIAAHPDASPELLNKAAQSVLTMRAQQTAADDAAIEGRDAQGRQSGDANIPSHLSAESQDELRSAVANQKQRTADAQALLRIDPMGAAQALRDVGRDEVAAGVEKAHIAETEAKAKGERDALLERQEAEAAQAQLITAVSKNPALFRQLPPSQKAGIIADLPGEAIASILDSPRSAEDQEAFMLRRAELIRKFAARKDIGSVAQAEALVDRLMDAPEKPGTGGQPAVPDDPQVKRAVEVLKGLSTDEQRESLELSKTLTSAQKRAVRQALGLEGADASDPVADPAVAAAVETLRGIDPKRAAAALNNIKSLTEAQKGEVRRILGLETASAAGMMHLLGHAGQSMQEVA